MIFHMAGRLHDIRRDCACRRKLARAAPVKHQGSHHISAHHHRIVHVVHAVKGVIRPDHHRADKYACPPVFHTAAAKELDRRPQLLCIPEIRIRNMRDPLSGNLLIIDLSLRSQGGQYRNLAACIIALDIRLGIALRIAQLLGLCKRLLKCLPFPIHLGQDIVCGTV